MIQPPPRPPAPGILFLDIDGVLNSGRFYVRRVWRYECHPRHIDPNAVARLNALVARSGADVVLSSAWRHHGLGNVLAALADRGFAHRASVIGHTLLDFARTLDRHEEIARWLDDHPGDGRPFVVLDDDPRAWHPDGRHNHRGLHVQPAYATGLQNAHVAAALTHLAKVAEIGGAKPAKPL